MKKIDLEELRLFILKASVSKPSIRRARLYLFDKYRYEENYEKLYDFVKDLGGPVE